MDLSEDCNMSQYAKLQPQLYLFEHHIPSKEMKKPEVEGQEQKRAKKLTFVEHMATKSLSDVEARRQRCQRNRSRKTAVMDAAEQTGACKGPSIYHERRERSSTIHRQRAQSDLRSTYHSSKSLPPLPAQGLPETMDEVFVQTLLPPQGLPESMDEVFGGDDWWGSSSPAPQSKDSRLDGLLEGVKTLVGCVKARYDDGVRDIRLCMAWEVEEMV